MNILEQSVTVQDVIFHPATWWVGGIIFYIFGGIILRNIVLRHCAKKNTLEGHTRLSENQDIGVFFTQFLFPISIIGIILAYLFFNENKKLDVYHEACKKYKESKK